LPNLRVRQISRGHVGAGHTFPDCLKQFLLIKRVPDSAVPQIGAASAFSPGTVATRAGVREQLAAGCYSDRVSEGGVLAFLILIFAMLCKQGHNDQQCGKPAHM
jgi:hypothetical protein